MLEKHFLPVDIGAIKNISLSRDPLDDSLILFFDPKGLFSFRGGYKVALDLTYSYEASSSADSNFWKKRI